MKKKIIEQEALIQEIKKLSLEVKNNLDCCDKILEYLEPQRKDKSRNLRSLIENHPDYLYFVLQNHLQLSILILKTLVSPNHGDNTKEFSPFYKSLTFDSKSIADLKKIKSEFKDFGLLKYRDSIAHKSDTESINTIKYSFRRGDMEILNNTRTIYNKFNKWLTNNFNIDDYDVIEWYDNDFLMNGLTKVLSYIEVGLSLERLERRKYRDTVWPTAYNTKRGKLGYF